MIVTTPTKVATPKKDRPIKHFNVRDFKTPPQAVKTVSAVPKGVYTDSFDSLWKSFEIPDIEMLDWPVLLRGCHLGWSGDNHSSSNPHDPRLLSP